MTLLMRGGATRASSVLARRGDQVAVIDTGIAQHEASLVAALAAQGLTPADVTLVFNTHAHVDHSHNNSVFPRARIFCSRQDRDWTLAIHAVLSSVEQPEAKDVLPFYPGIAGGSYNPKIIRKVLGIEKLLWDERRWAPAERAVWLEAVAPPDGISVMPTPGHSPHHVSFVVQTADVPVLVCGDALLLRDESTYGAPMMPPWSGALYLESRNRIMTFRGLIVPGHDEPFHIA